jgi:hypothetical protein
VRFSEFLLAEKQLVTNLYKRLKNVYGASAVDKITVSRCASRIAGSEKQCRRDGEKPVQITGTRQSRRVPEARLYCIYFFFLGSIIICRLYALTLSDQSQVVLQLTASLSDFV